ncbi:MAG: leucyl aminopeptidase [Dehalococcoidia bacterium]|nr:leucyl aminopeptidase [Dehalococcoidia bacterium]
MDIDVTQGNLTDQSADTYVITVERGARFAGELAALDRALGGAIRRMQGDGVLKGESSEFHVLPRGGRVRAARSVIVGVGRGEALSADKLRNRIADVARRLRGLNAGRVVVSTQALAARLGPEQAGRTLAEGLLLGLYRFDKHHTQADDRPSGVIDSITLAEPAVRRAAQVRGGAETGVVLAEATNLARDMENEPANLMTPSVMAGHARDVASEHGLDCTIIERAEAERLGMGSYLSVSTGSVQPPKFIVLNYHGGGRARPIALVGKGITFDSGGISIKPAGGMEAMKADMSGAACVIASMAAIARLAPRVNVMAVAPCTENLPSGSATKPGDVVYAMDGQSIEVINTDAEGRLVLADALVYARQQGAAAMVDVATLTGAMATTLGNVRTGVFANNDRVWSDLERASAASGEKLWRLPLDDEYERQIKSDVADIKNTGGRPAGSITAAKFLQHFAGDTPWAHMDIAGVMSAGSDRGVLVKGMTGIPVRTLVHWTLGRAR